MEPAPRTDPFGLVGTLLERKYRIDRTVAEGGFGIVYAAHHLALDLPVAVKVLKRRADQENDAWQELLGRFVQEAQTIARLRHPNVVSVLDTGIAHLDAGAVPWIVLDWLDGRTLREDLDDRQGRGGRSPREAVDLLRPVIQAVAEAHQARIAHRDLKPCNVMLVPARRGGSTPRVLDFGVAKVMHDDQRLGSGHTTTQDAFRAFSLGYAAPEQIAGARTGPWTDVHALGLMLTEALVDTRPYPGDATEQHARAFDSVRPTPARFGVDVGSLEAVIARAVALRPTDRYADAGELLAAIEEAMAEVRGAPAALDRDSQTNATVRDVPRPHRSRVAWTGVLVVLAAMAIGGGAVALSGGGAQAVATLPTTAPIATLPPSVSHEPETPALPAEPTTAPPSAPPDLVPTPSRAAPRAPVPRAKPALAPSPSPAAAQSPASDIAVRPGRPSYVPE